VLGTAEEILIALRERVINGFSAYFQANSPEDTLQALETFRILSALRQGHLGVVTLNRLIEQIFVEKGLISIETSRGYHKQPIMITQNDYSLDLFNGDVGVILRDPKHQQTLRAFFLTAKGNLRDFLPTRLPAYETVYAMTIHKSQGSEFDNVLILLPNQFSIVLSRELLYTGLTRARRCVELWANETVLKQTLNQKIQRMSGLYEALVKC
jgi:exodeoxyribonuclease V alpha subunit